MITNMGGREHLRGQVTPASRQGNRDESERISIGYPDYGLNLRLSRMKGVGVTLTLSAALKKQSACVPDSAACTLPGTTKDTVENAPVGFPVSSTCPGRHC